ncbi:MAG: dephospho-CoA kinase [Thermoleophilaceae bacterium]
MAGEPARPSDGGHEERIPFVGLTGGIASGKSEALRILEDLGAATLSSDLVVHELIGTDEVRDALVERYGAEIAPGGEVDRSKVGERAFADPGERSWIERLIWPKVGERIAGWYAELGHRSPRPPAAIVEVPLLFESGMERVFDQSVAVVADEDVRAERAGARGHAALEERASRQLNQEEKAARATHVVQNDAGFEELREHLASLLERMIA